MNPFLCPHCAHLDRRTAVMYCPHCGHETSMESDRRLMEAMFAINSSVQQERQFAKDQLCEDLGGAAAILWKPVGIFVAACLLLWAVCQ